MFDTQIQPSPVATQPPPGSRLILMFYSTTTKRCPCAICGEPGEVNAHLAMALWIPGSINAPEPICRDCYEIHQSLLLPPARDIQKELTALAAANAEYLRKAHGI